MTPQLQFVAVGAVAAAAAKFYFQADNQKVLLWALGAIAIAAILTAKKSDAN